MGPCPLPAQRPLWPLIDAVIGNRYAAHIGADVRPMAFVNHGARKWILGLCLPAALGTVTDRAALAQSGSAPRNVGHPTFASPHARPIARNGSFIYVANTPADTVDVLDVAARALVGRIHVGIDPVSIAVRPDGSEVWVANHVSDTVSVIDANPSSPAFHQVIATVQNIDPATFSTRFDEPVGIAFANDRKAYVALSTSNRIAIVDVATRTVTGHLPIRAQDPRAIAVQGNRLYVIPFESGNQTQLSGCFAANLDGDLCTFDLWEHVVSNNNVLSQGYNADVVKHPGVPDRDLFVFNTETDALEQVVSGLGTLLYGLAVDSDHRVFVAHTDARNDANGRAGTRKDGLAQLDNRPWLNRIAQVDCSGECSTPRFFDLEPLPPLQPEPGMALATPFGIALSEDESTLVVTAAGSDKLFIVDANTGAVSRRVGVGVAPRGLTLISDNRGAPLEAWVLNAISNTVSVVDLGAQATAVGTTIALEDPTPADVKRGRLAFNSAEASSSGTFACASCHPDAHTDQLLWVLETPACDLEGCTQTPPRLTMPVRGLQDTEPFYWDGVPGDPFGGINTASVNTDVPPTDVLPTRDATEPGNCLSSQLDSSLGTTMCDTLNCPVNDEDKAGLLDAADRDAMARFLMSVPYPPAPAPPIDNVLSLSAREGFFESSSVNDAAERTTGAQTCGACHKDPFLTSTNTPSTGMEATTFRGAHDRWTVLSQGRVNLIDLLRLVGLGNGIEERDPWILIGLTPAMWEMILEGSTGFSGSFARQTTLNAETAQLPQTARLLKALEGSAAEGAIRLLGQGVRIADGVATPFAVEFLDGTYQTRTDGATQLPDELSIEKAQVTNDGTDFDRSTLLEAARDGALVLTLTGRAGVHADAGNPQPALWADGAREAQTRNVAIPFLGADSTLRFKGRHLHDRAALFVNGRRVAGTLGCETGRLPECDVERLVARFVDAPQPGGLHFLQVQNPEGLFSNDMMFFSNQAPLPPRPGNLLASGGAFTPGAGQFDKHWNTVELATNAISEIGGEVRIDLKSAAVFPWHAQISHAAMVIAGQQYTLCYDARAAGPRFITAYMDSNLDEWRNISGGQHRAHLTTTRQRFSHTFTVAQTDLFARVAFDLAQSPLDVQLDNIGLYEGSTCGVP
ncbi:MAG: beta-propeller fold lactonase family protein [Gammaproteobacteria bacterium]|nr:beta-propeller fold lactonase family protein [Gammaproteobacteria bacterium]